MKPIKREGVSTTAMDTALKENTRALAAYLTEASRIAEEARTALDDGGANRGVATLLPLERLLPYCSGLLQAILALQGERNNSATASPQTSGKRALPRKRGASSK